MPATIAKWWQTIQIGWTKYLAYKLNFVLLVLGPTLVFFFIKYNLWTAIYDLEGLEQIQGYDLDSMLAYQVWVMVVGFLAQSYNSMNLAEDIRLGRISSYLIYPFGFWQFHTANFIAILAVQTLVAAFTVMLVTIANLIPPADFYYLIQGVLIAWVVGFLWFQIAFIIGLMAFWLEETWVLRVIFTTVAQFFSGAIIPLDLYPDWLRQILDWTPFPYLTYVPVRVFMGESDISWIQAVMVPCFWLGVALLIGQWVWSRGLRLYTAAGM